MPLFDHFTPPVPPRANWQSFHHHWAGVIADHLDATLPAEFFARVEVNLGTEVAASSELAARAATDTPQAVWPASYPHDAAVQVRTAADGGRLVAVVELVSPANKDRPAARAGFVAKCAGYLQAGVGLVVADAVFTHGFNLHDELAALMGGVPMPHSPPAYAAAYRPAADQVDVWFAELRVGRPLPTLPLALRGRGCVPLDLERLYAETCRRVRLTSRAAA